MFYVAYGVGNLAQVVGAALEIDDDAAVRRCGQRIQACKRHLESWVDRAQGRVIADFGSAGIIEIEPDNDEALGLADVVQQLNEYLGGMHLAFGIGMSCGEAWRALRQAAERGEPYKIYEPGEAEQEDPDELDQQLSQGKDLQKGDVIGFPQGRVTAPHRYRKNAEVVDARGDFQQARDEHVLAQPAPVAAVPAAVPGIGGGKSTYDYSHELPDGLRQAGYQVHLTHSPEHAHYMNTTVLKDGQPVGQGWAYPLSDEPKVAAAQGVDVSHVDGIRNAQYKALHAHQQYAKGLIERRDADERQTYAPEEQHLSVIQPAKEPSDAQIIPFKKSEAGATKSQIREALQKIKEQAGAFEVLKQTAPEAYQALERVIMAMVMMSHQMTGDVEKAESVFKRLKGVRAATTMKYPDAAARTDGGGAANLTQQKKSKPIDPLTGQAQGNKWHSVRSGQVMGTGGGAVPSREPNQP